jgi:hypothetical protein
MTKKGADLRIALDHDRLVGGFFFIDQGCSSFSLFVFLFFSRSHLTGRGWEKRGPFSPAEVGRSADHSRRQRLGEEIWAVDGGRA